MHDEQKKTKSNNPTKEGKERKMIMSEKDKRSEAIISCGEMVLNEANTSEYSSPLIKMPGSVNGRLAEVMIDCGSSSEFISSSFVEHHRMKTEKLEKEQKVQLADGREYVVKQMVRKANVRWDGWSGMVSLLVLPLSHYDIILGMKWLKEFNPKIDWRTGKCFANISAQNHTDVKHSISSLALSGNDHQIRDGKQKLVLNLLSARKWRKEMRSGGEGGVIHVMLKSNSNENEKLMMKVEEDELGEKKLLPIFNINNSTANNYNYNLGANQLMKILKEYQDVFPDELPKGIPPQRGVYHRIDLLPGSKPPSQAAYRTSPADSAELKKQIDMLLAHGFIVPSTSPFGAPVLFVKKKDGSVRMCVDFRALNKITERNNSGLPRMEELFDRVLGAKIFSKLDLRSGYHQIPLHPDDTAKTAFNSRFGHFEFTVLPFGLTNAPATFSTLMQKIFHPYLDEFVVVFLDDILIFSKNEKDHAIHLSKALEILRENKLYAKQEKCKFFQTTIDFLGHVITPEGIAVEPAKVEAIENWPSCKTVEDIRSFLGLCGFHRRFVEHFARKALPLTNLTKKANKWKWENEEQEAMDLIKYSLTHAPILLTPDPTRSYTIACDASGYATGAVLMQDHGKGLQPVAYMSKKMLDAERNYPTGEQEQLAIICALKEWRHLIHGVKVTVLTDNSPLQHILTTPDLSRRQVRWMEVLAQFDLTIIYRPGKDNTVADALSRRRDHRVNEADEMEKKKKEKKEQLKMWQVKESLNETSHEMAEHVATLIVVSVDEIQERVRKANLTDRLGKEILETLNENSSRLENENLILRKDRETEATRKQKKQKLIEKGWRLNNELLYFKRRLYIPDDRLLRSDLLVEAHDSKLNGHFGVEKTISQLAKYYYWVNMGEEVKEYINSCLACSTGKSSNLHPAGLLHPLPIPVRRWEQVSIDFITQLPETQKSKNTALMVMVDKVSKMVHIAACKTTINAVESAELFYENVIRYHGVPRSIVSDRDPRFTSNFWRALWALLGTKLKMSTADHPQSDGQTEVTNKTIENMVRHYVNTKLNNWDENLIAIEIAINNAVHTGTGYSPFQLNSGQNPNFPLSVAAGLVEEGKGVNETANEFIRRISVDLETAKKNLLIAQQNQIEQANKHRRAVKYKVGDQVLLSTAKLSTHNNKFQSRFIGPFVIERVLSDVLVQLELPTVMGRRFNKFHISKLREWKEDPLRFPTRRQINRPIAEVVDENEKEWEVERILADRVLNDNKIQYLIVWKGYPIEDATWEPEDNLANAQNILNNYKQQKKEEEEKNNEEDRELEEKKESEKEEEETLIMDEEEKKYTEEELQRTDSNDEEQSEWNPPRRSRRIQRKKRS